MPMVTGDYSWGWEILVAGVVICAFLIILGVILSTDWKFIKRNNSKNQQTL